MKEYSVEAFVLRLRPLGEADRILTLFSRERGKLSAVAKGSRATRSKFGARLDFFARSSLTLHTGRNLDIITGAALVANAWDRLVDPDVFASVGYVAEIIDSLCEPDLAVPEIYDLLCELQTLVERGEATASMLPAIDLRLLGALGLAPELEACARCGSALGRRPLSGGRCKLSPQAGGLVCRRCALGSLRGDAAERDATAIADTTAFSVSASELRMLQALRGMPLQLAAARPEIAALRSRTRPFVEYQLGRRSKALSVLDVHARPRGARRNVRARAAGA
jgi:DNA repair protein RecO (recombination protein O)